MYKDKVSGKLCTGLLKLCMRNVYSGKLNNIEGCYSDTQYCTIHVGSTTAKGCEASL